MNTKRPASVDQKQIEVDAAEWLARHDAGLSATDRVAFERWLATSPAHRSAWELLESTWAAFDAPRNRGSVGEIKATLHAKARRRRQWRLTVAAVAASAALIIAAFQIAPRKSAPSLTNAPVVVRVDRRVLPDNSVVDLNDGAEIVVSYRPKQRDVRLLRGTAHFTVAKNPARPFVVTAGNVQFRAVGTQFLITLEATDTNLLVTEGRVAIAASPTATVSGTAVAPAGAVQDLLLVSAGETLVLPKSPSGDAPLAPQAQTVSPEQIERQLEWRHPRVVLSHTALNDAVAIISRESHTVLSVRDPALLRLRLSGVFHADNAEGFVRILEANYGVRALRENGATVLVAAGH